MRVVNMQEAKAHLSRLVQAAVDGEPFVIARAGRPLVKVVPINTPEPAEARRTGFMADEISVPPNFDGMGSTEIEAMFDGEG